METEQLTGGTLSGKGVFTGRRGDPMTAQRCLAKTRRGTLCQRAAEKNPKTGLRKRCRLHGGLSTGPKNPAMKHGKYSAAAREARLALQAKLAELKNQTEGLK